MNRATGVVPANENAIANNGNGNDNDNDDGDGDGKQGLGLTSVAGAAPETTMAGIGDQRREFVPALYWVVFVLVMLLCNAGIGIDIAIAIESG
ncbi:hypothetical protein LTR40_009553 [Exophiala xenobiotica]|nr:hypothetical protein LTR40_009553 [Exophiala xenobiotica]